MIRAMSKMTGNVFITPTILHAKMPLYASWRLIALSYGDPPEKATWL
jgi:hypothetical protein